MKNTLFLVFLLGLLLVSAADRITLFPGKSFLIDNKNITLVQIDDKNDVAIFCVNGVKDIIKDDDEGYVNDVFIEVIDIKAGIVTIDVDFDCDGECPCDDCNNDVCLNGDVEEFMEEDVEEEVVVELLEAAVPIPITLKMDAVKVIRRAGEENPEEEE